MSHMIDVNADGKATMAYVGDEPWHRLGQKLTPGAPIEVWMQEAGLGYDVKRAPVSYHDGHSFKRFDAKHVIYRADTGAPLSVMGNELVYKLVQPSQVMGFFSKIIDRHGFTLETAGALDGGRRVWVLARINDGAPILPGDVVRPYLLGATSYDGSMSSTFKLTAIRVVCHNTLTASAGYSSGTAAGRGQSETDTANSIIRVPHSKDFDADAVRVDLGIYLDSWGQWLAQTRRLARVAVDDAFVVQFLRQLLPQPAEGKPPADESLTGERIRKLFHSGTGQQLEGAQGTAWGLLNAVTEYVDHKRGVAANRRSSAWFGTGEGMKARAQELLVKIAA